MSQVSETALKRALWRADHRGTKEADMLIGGFAKRFLPEMTAEEFAWFELLLQEQDVDIMAWAFGRGSPPDHLQSPMLEKLMTLDYVTLVRR